MGFSLEERPSNEHVRRPFDRVTLAAVAQAAGVTIPTLQRRFGNKEGLFAACGSRVGVRIVAQRGSPPVGNIKGCIAEEHRKPNADRRCPSRRPGKIAERQGRA